MNAPGLRVAVALGGVGDAAAWRRTLALVERAEALGLHSAWLPESHFQRGAMSAPLVVLSALAGRTRRLRLATTSLLLPIHHPLRVAADVASLDVLSGGRVILGLGRGFRSPVFRGFGVAQHSKRDRFDEALDAILGAWAGVPVDLAGTHFEGRAAGRVRLALPPVQRPHPPLVVAAFGRKGLLQAAARGLPYLASPLETLETLAENYALWRERRNRAAPEPELRAPVMRSVHVARDDRDTLRARAALAEERRRLPARMPPALARAARGRLEDRVIVGTAPEVTETIERYRERLGMDLLVVRSPPEAGAGAAEASLERLVERVLPALAVVSPPPPPRG